MKKNIILNTLLLSFLIFQPDMHGDNNKRLKEWETPYDNKPNDKAKRLKQYNEPLQENEIPLNPDDNPINRLGEWETPYDNKPNDKAKRLKQYNEPLQENEIPLNPDDNPINRLGEWETPLQLQNQPGMLGGIINWIKDKFGFGNEENPQIKELEHISVTNTPLPGRGYSKSADVISTFWIPEKGVSYPDNITHKSEYGRRYQGYSHRKGPTWETAFKDAPNREGSDLDVAQYPIAEKVIANAPDYIKIAKDYYKKGYDERRYQEQNINKQKFRKEGVQNALYGIAALGATSYGIYRLINWLRGDLHALKKNIHHAQQAIAKSIYIIEKKGFKAESDEILYRDIYNSQSTLKGISDSIIKEEIRRKTAKK